MSYFFLLIAAFLFFNIDNETWVIIKSTIADAYINVTSFVAGTLLIFFFLEKFFNIDLNKLLHNRPKLEVFVSSALGSLPGCGGAIIVLTQYSRGKISFGSVVATLTATMGDAAFLLLAKDPKIGFLIMIIGFLVGFVSGILVNKIHGKSFMKINGCDIIRLNCKPSNYKASKTLDIFWVILLIPGIILGVLSAFQINLEEYFVNDIIENPITFFGFFAGSLCLIMWIIPVISGLKYSPSKSDENVIRRTVADSNFITTWVILAFLAYELTVHLGNINLEAIFQSYFILIPLIGILIGFLPGCGPQILVTTLYLNGIIPLSAQIGNAISNDGDALFPAIALHPKAALIATIYSGVPAIIVSYGYFFSFEF
ncbi:putative manganese transporter [Alphaproteobacteria bacterium]|nr:putative manganese transporter [Alphaproteobacteria bacterium]